jgi:hypothetical protein
MKTYSEAEFNDLLDAQFPVKHGLDVAELLLLDPKNRYANGFNRLMENVDAEFIDTAYLKPLAVTATLVETGVIADRSTLFKMLCGIQKRIAKNFLGRTAQHANPQIRFRRCRGDNSPRQESIPLFVTSDANFDHAGSDVCPSFALEQRELFSVLLSEAREMGRLGLRVFREVRRYEAIRRTTFGAFIAVARLAELDAAGRIIAIRCVDPNRQVGERPAKAVVDQVRKFYHEAADYLDDRRRGWNCED